MTYWDDGEENEYNQSLKASGNEGRCLNTNGILIICYKKHTNSKSYKASNLMCLHNLYCHIVLWMLIAEHILTIKAFY